MIFERSLKALLQGEGFMPAKDPLSVELLEVSGRAGSLANEIYGHGKVLNPTGSTAFRSDDWNIELAHSGSVEISPVAGDRSARISLQLDTDGLTHASLDGRTIFQRPRLSVADIVGGEEWDVDSVRNMLPIIRKLELALRVHLPEIAAKASGLGDLNTPEGRSKRLGQF